MLHVIGLLHLPNAHMPCPCMEAFFDLAWNWLISLERYIYSMFVLAGFCLCRMPLAEMCTCHVRCM